MLSVSAPLPEDVCIFPRPACSPESRASPATTSQDSNPTGLLLDQSNGKAVPYDLFPPLPAGMVLEWRRMNATIVHDRSNRVGAPRQKELVNIVITICYVPLPRIETSKHPGLKQQKWWICGQKSHPGVTIFVGLRSKRGADIQGVEDPRIGSVR